MNSTASLHPFDTAPTKKFALFSVIIFILYFYELYDHYAIFFFEYGTNRLDFKMHFERMKAIHTTVHYSTQSLKSYPYTICNELKFHWRYFFVYYSETNAKNNDSEFQRNYEQSTQRSCLFRYKIEFLALQLNENTN